MAWGYGTTVDDAEAYEGALSLDMGAGPEDEQPDQVTEIPTPRNNISFYLDEDYGFPVEELGLTMGENQPPALFDFFTLGMNASKKPGGFLGVGGNL